MMQRSKRPVAWRTARRRAAAAALALLTAACSGIGGGGISGGVVGKEPVGGVKDITVTKGDRIRLVVTSDQQEHDDVESGERSHARGLDASQQVVNEIAEPREAM